MNEYAMCNAQYQLNVLESYIAKVKNQFKTLNEEISLLEVEYQAYSHLTNEEAEIETSWYVLILHLISLQKKMNKFFPFFFLLVGVNCKKIWRIINKNSSTYNPKKIICKRLSKSLRR